MTTPQEKLPDAHERRSRALARLESTGNIEAVARAFNITPDELLTWASEASASERTPSSNLDQAPINEMGGKRFAPRLKSSNESTYTGQVILIIGLVAIAPFVLSLVGSSPALDPLRWIFEKVVLEPIWFVVKFVVALVIWIADSH